MEAKTRFAVVTMALAISGFALADAEFRSAGAGPVMPLAGRASRQECWIEHVQVQPARAIDSTVQGSPLGSGNAVWASGEHLGSEHWNADAQRACRLQWLTGIAAGNYLGRRHGQDNWAASP